MNFDDLSLWELNPRTVSRSFRDILVCELPGLGTDERYWMFLEYLIFTGLRDVGYDLSAHTLGSMKE